MMKLDPDLLAAAQAASTKYDVPLATILGVVEQESAGKIYAEVDGRNEPVIRWEGHYFYRLLTEPERTTAVRAKLAAKSAGQIKNPAAQQDRWDKLLKPAMAISRKAAIESASWGVGQVMGDNWESLKYASAENFLESVRSGVGGQIDAMMRFCDVNKLLPAMRRGDFASFARRYNGPGAVGSYSKSMGDKVKAWEKKLGAGVPGTPIPPPTVREGDSGKWVAEVQAHLNMHGIPVSVDSQFGPATRKAVEDFQRSHGLSVDGVVGPASWAALANSTG
jgi:murein L,D-transpeptidase YcbB/YkuD